MKKRHHNWLINSKTGEDHIMGKGQQQLTTCGIVLFGGGVGGNNGFCCEQRKYE